MGYVPIKTHRFSPTDKEAVLLFVRFLLRVGVLPSEIEGASRISVEVDYRNMDGNVLIVEKKDG